MKTGIKNIVLIGMPGCGKTTIGKLLASKLNKKFIDLDDYIESENGCSIPDIFKNGEECFRKLESKAVEKISVEKNIIIATGGGVIKNGIVVFIDRPLENIISDVDISGRPLLKKGINEIEKIYNERYDIYKAYCDFSVHNTLNLEAIVDDIVKSCNEYI